MLTVVDYIANKGLAGLCGFNILLFILAKGYYIWRNRVMERKYESLSTDEKTKFFDARFSH